MRRPSFIHVIVLSTAAVSLAGCESLTRTLGFTRDAPDEFTVTTRAPLAIPSTFDLPPPRPGAPRPQEQPERVQAEQALVPQTALGSGPAPDSPGQETLVKLAGPPASPNIRDEVNSEVGLDKPRQTLTDRLMFWEPSPQPGTVVDATKESQRLRENSALGKNPEVGDTPIVQPKRRSLFGTLDLF